MKTASKLCGQCIIFCISKCSIFAFLRVVRDTVILATFLRSLYPTQNFSSNVFRYMLRPLNIIHIHDCHYLALAYSALRQILIFNGSLQRSTIVS